MRELRKGHVPGDLRGGSPDNGGHGCEYEGTEKATSVIVYSFSKPISVIFSLIEGVGWLLELSFRP